MHTSWRRHRRHAIANLLFRVAAASGFVVGLAVTVFHQVPSPSTCDIQHADCLARVLRYEAVAHLLPPVAGLLAGMIVGSWLARAVHRAYARANERAMG